MDLLRRHRTTEDVDRTRPPAGSPEMGPDAGNPPAEAVDEQPSDTRQRVVGGAARTGPAVPIVDRRPGEADDPLERPTAPTPVTTADDATEPRGHRAVGEGRRWPWGRASEGVDTPEAVAAREQLHERELERERERDLRERDVDERRPARREREVVDEVVVRRWSIADALITALGAALAVVGVLGLVRAEVNGTWYQPVVEVATADHTPLLAAVEVGVGVLIALAGIARRRIIATLLGVGTAVAAAVAALETAEVSRELAIEDWWAWVLFAGGVLVALLAVVPRKGRIERVTRTDTAEAERRSARRHGVPHPA